MDQEFTACWKLNLIKQLLQHMNKATMQLTRPSLQLRASRPAVARPSLPAPLAFRTSRTRLAPGSQRPTVPSTVVHAVTESKPKVETTNGAPKLQSYSSGPVNVQTPIALVQQLSPPLQAGAFLAYFGLLATATYAAVTIVAPGIEATLPTFFAFSRTLWPLLGITYVLAGVGHFALLDSFVTMMPKQGAWGLWNLPGDAAFHVRWTGVAEVLGGSGVLLGALGPVAERVPWLQPASALGLFILTLAVTPSNIYMLTHNAPGPLARPGVAIVDPIPLPGHAARGALQVFLLGTLWGLAEPLFHYVR